MPTPPAVQQAPAPTSRRALVYLGVCVVLVGLNLRTVFSSFSAILPEITAAAGLPSWAVTVLTTAPVTLLGVFAPLAPRLARRHGAETVLLGAMVLLAAGLAARGLPLSAGATVPLLLAGTLACGAAIAVGNVLLPSIVKRDFTHRLGLMSGLYTTAIAASAALGAGLTYPLFQATGSWRTGLAGWAAPAALVVLLLIPVVARRRPASPAPARAGDAAGDSPWRSPVAWQITGFMVFQAMMSFSVFAWLAPILRDRGVDGATAGVVVAVSILLQMTGSLFAPALAVRLADQRVLNAVVALMAGGGFVLSIFGPLQLIWVWTGLLGLGQGALTAVALTMIALRTRSAAMAVRLSGMMQGVGYGLGSSGTFLVGQLLHATGGFAAAGVMFAVVGVLAAVFGWQAGRDRSVQER
ncbi:MFS transporter [Kocuria sp. KH4]